MNPGPALRCAVGDTMITGGCVALPVDDCFGNLNSRGVIRVVAELFERREFGLHLRASPHHTANEHARQTAAAMVMVMV